MTTPQGTTPPPPDPGGHSRQRSLAAGTRHARQRRQRRCRRRERDRRVRSRTRLRLHGRVRLDDGRIEFGIRPASAVYNLTATDTATGATISHFSGSPVLTISYDPSKPTPTAIYYLDPVNGPVALPSTVDTVHHTITRGAAALQRVRRRLARGRHARALAADPPDGVGLGDGHRDRHPGRRRRAAARPSTSSSAAPRRSAADVSTCLTATRRQLHRDDLRHHDRGGHDHGRRDRVGVLLPAPRSRCPSWTP